jgi:hypothetical protein
MLKELTIHSQIHRVWQEKDINISIIQTDYEYILCYYQKNINVLPYLTFQLVREWVLLENS